MRWRHRRHSPRGSHGRGYSVELQSSPKHKNVLSVSRSLHGHAERNRTDSPRRAAQQLALDLQVDLYSSGLTTTLRRLEQSLRDISAFLHPHHGLLMTLKRSLMLCYSQAKQGTLGRSELERMKTIALVCNSSSRRGVQIFYCHHT